MTIDILRNASLSTIVAAMAMAFGGAEIHAQQTRGPAEVPLADLMQPGELPELVMGKPEAKVTIVEYASTTCPHCADFHNNVLPELAKKYIDTGKVRLVLREFPRDPADTAAFMLARCAGGDRTLPFIETLFRTQHDWTSAPDKVAALLNIAKQAGFTEEKFTTCLKDEKLLGQLRTGQSRAAEVFGVSSTPTFFIDGRRLTTAPTLADFDKALEPLLAKN